MNWFEKRRAHKAAERITAKIAAAFEGQPVFVVAEKRINGGWAVEPFKHLVTVHWCEVLIATGIEAMRIECQGVEIAVAL